MRLALAIVALVAIAPSLAQAKGGAHSGVSSPARTGKATPQAGTMSKDHGTHFKPAKSHDSKGRGRGGRGGGNWTGGPFLPYGITDSNGGGNVVTTSPAGTIAWSVMHGLQSSDQSRRMRAEMCQGFGNASEQNSCMGPYKYEGQNNTLPGCRLTKIGMECDVDATKP